MNQAVTVTIGAVLGGGFLSAFKDGEVGLVSFGKVVNKLDTALIRLDRHLKGPTQNVTAMVTGMTNLSSVTTTNANATRHYVDQTRKLSREGLNVAKSYEVQRKELEKLNAALRATPPPIPPRMPRSSTGLSGSAGQGNVSSFLQSAGGGMRGTGMMATAAGAGIVATGLASVFSSTEFGSKLAAIVTTAGEDINFIPELKERIFAQAGLTKTGQTSQALADFVNILVAGNRDLRSEVLPSMKLAGMTATATGAGMEDVSKATLALMDGFRLTPVQLKEAFNRMAIAGKEGRFEFKDMARFLPKISGMASGNKITGIEGLTTITAAYQAVLKGAGSTEQAATNLENLLGAMNSQEVRRNFQENGINLEALVKGGQSQGKDALTTFVDFMKTRTKGDAFRIADFMQDRQAKDAILALVQHNGLFNDVKKRQTSGEDVLSVDFTKMLRADPSMAMNSFKDSLFKIGNTIATVLAPTLFKLSIIFDKVATKVLKFSSDYPMLTTAIVEGAAGMGIFLIAGGLAVTLLGSLASSVGSLAAGWGTFAAAFPAGAAKITGLFASLKGVFVGIGAAIGGITLPVALVIGAIVAAGVLVYKYWQPIKAFFVGVGEGMMEAFAPLITELQPMFTLVGQTISWLGGKLGELWTWFKQFIGQSEFASDELHSVGNAGRTVGRVVGTFIVTPIRLAIAILKPLAEGIGWVAGKLFDFASFVIDSPLFNVLKDGFLTVVSPIKMVFDWVVKLIDKFYEAKGIFGNEAGVGATTDSQGRNVWQIRDALIKSGGINQTWMRDDSIEADKFVSGVASNNLGLDSLRILRNEAGGKLGSGDNLDAAALSAIDALIAIRMQREAASGAGAQVTNQLSTVINVDKTNASPEDIAKANDTAQRKLASDISRQERNSFMDSYE